MKLSATFVHFLFAALAAGLGHSEEVPCSTYNNDPYACSSGEDDTGCIWCTNDGDGQCVYPEDVDPNTIDHGTMCELLEDPDGGERNLRLGEKNNEEGEEEPLSEVDLAATSDAILKQLQNHKKNTVLSSSVAKSNNNDGKSRNLQGWSTWTVAVDCYDSSLSATNTGDKITVKFYSATGRLLGTRSSFGYKDCAPGKYEFWTIGSRFDVYAWSIQTNGRDAFYMDEIYLVKDVTDIVAFTFKNYCLSKDRKDHINLGWKRLRVVGRCRPKHSFFYV